MAQIWRSRVVSYSAATSHSLAYISVMLATVASYSGDHLALATKKLKSSDFYGERQSP